MRTSADLLEPVLDATRAALLRAERDEGIDAGGATRQHVVTQF
jgi:hypothetical protein